ncbi:MAG: Nucleoside-diphosphate-sugar epimerase [Chloroflexi bacterium]|jgi:nucleoside-diphosphate-sugar epimerase|nr:MAG: Nucleoside-diphosphate-sugar epimerase [Chloroflexota bacterium]
MTTLITGTGLLGTSFAQQAIKRGERLVFFDAQPNRDFLRHKLGDADVGIIQGDIRDLPALVGAMKDNSVTTVVHTVGLIGGKVASPVYTGFQVNIQGTINVAEAVRLTGVKRLVHMSTFGVYDRRQEGKIHFDEDFPRASDSAYGASKVAKEMVLEAYQGIYGFELVMIRPANAFGFGHFAGGSSGGEKVQNLVIGGVRGETAKIPNNQTMSFEYVYAKDAGVAIDRAATVPLPPKIAFNIGNGEVLTFEELVGSVKKALPNLSVDILPGDPPSFNPKVPMDISLAKQHLGWAPTYDMEAAFRDYAADLKAAGLV